MNRINLESTLLQSALDQAVATLRDGGLVIFPTETMYGVAADACNEKAITKLLQFKNRPVGKPISVLVTDQAAAEQLVELTEEAKNLYATFLPGPVTVISQDKGVVDPRLPSEEKKLGIRISSHPIAAALAEAYGKPITATSANASGKARPYSIEIMLAGLNERQTNLIDTILDAGELPHNEPSTVIDVSGAIQSVIRAGGILEQVAPSITSHSEEETITEAERLMKGFLHVLPEKAVVFALEGEMGAGKTRFAKGVAQALGITQPVSSPTYTIMKEYEGHHGELPVTFIHIDCWRLEDDRAGELGISEYLKPGTAVVIEWAAPLLNELKRANDQLVGYHIFLDTLSDTDRQIRIGAL